MSENSLNNLKPEGKGEIIISLAVKQLHLTRFLEVRGLNPDLRTCPSLSWHPESQKRSSDSSSSSSAEIRSVLVPAWSLLPDGRDVQGNAHNWCYLSRKQRSHMIQELISWWNLEQKLLWTLQTSLCSNTNCEALMLQQQASFLILSKYELIVRF